MELSTGVAELRVAPLAAEHRGRVAEILRATGMFSDDEVLVALELFDEEFGAHRAAPRARADEPVPLPGQRRLVAAAPRPAYHFLGLFAAGEALVGYACHGPTPAADRTHDLYWIAVHPEAQGAGAGSRLLAEVERRLAERSARLLVVETSGRAAYEGTRAFYRRHGYGEAARVRDFYAPGDDRIVFTKRLTPAAPPHPESHQSPATGGVVQR